MHLISTCLSGHHEKTILQSSTALNFSFIFGFTLSAALGFANVAVAEDIVTEGAFVGIKGQYLTPRFETDIAGGNSGFGPNSSLNIFNFDWEGQGAFRGWIGYEKSNGFGWSLGHFKLRGDTGFY